MIDPCQKTHNRTKRAQIVYFTGTGGTGRVVRALEKSLRDRGIEALKTPIDESRHHEGPAVDRTGDLLIMAFPVYAFDAPEPVYDWTKEIPEGNGLPVAVISVSGGGEMWPNTACRAGCIKLLEKRGYHVFYERMMIMPSNVFFPTEAQLAIRLLRILPSKAEHCVGEILQGTRRRKRPPLSSKIMISIFAYEKRASKRFGLNLRARDTCTGCGWCAGHCPRGNIEMADGRPVFDGRCVICMRCVYGCPLKAVYPRRYRSIAIKEGYDLDELERRIHGELAPPEKIRPGLLFMGVMKYLKKMEA